MVVEYMASYDRAFRRLPASAQGHAIKAIDRLLDYFSTGQRPHGLGLKRLRRDYWEVRIGLRLRILFELGRDRITFIFVGDHDALRDWLRGM
jgi:hypothetical protein